MGLCVCVKSNLTNGASVRPENVVTYSERDGRQNINEIFSETAPLQKYSLYSVHRHTYSPPFFHGYKRLELGFEQRVRTLVLFTGLPVSNQS